VAISQRLLDSELSRLAAGKSDSRKVLDIEEDVVEARTAGIERLIAYRKVLLELELAAGTVLDNRDIRVEPNTP
jgi:outer membrane protein TolC